MNDGPEIAELFVRKVTDVWELQRLERETLRGLAECGVDVLVGDTLAGGEEKDEEPDSVGAQGDQKKPLV